MIEKVVRLYKSGTLGLAVKGELGNGVSMLGSLLGSQRLIYNPWTYAIFHRVGLETAPTVIEAIRASFPHVRSVADFGCGTGSYVAEFRKHHVEAEGFEYSAVARRLARTAFNVDVNPFDLTTFSHVPRAFDLSMSFEVAEHLPPALGDRLVEVCCHHAPLVIFTAAKPGQTGQGHIHLQPKSFWIERFERQGFRFNQEQTDRIERFLRANLVRGFWLADNIGVYERGKLA